MQIDHEVFHYQQDWNLAIHFVQAIHCSYGWYLDLQILAQKGKKIQIITQYKT